MELSWFTKTKIAAAIALGVILVGFVGWPFVAPQDPYEPITLSVNSTRGINSFDAVVLALLAFAAGFLAYFVSWPYGSYIGVLAAPCGLAFWAGRSANLSKLLQSNPAAQQRMEIFSTLKWEPLFWLAVLVAGLGGVLTAEKLWPAKKQVTHLKKADSTSQGYLNIALAIVISGIIGHFALQILARDVRYADRVLGYVMAQPDAAQIGFAVVVSFGLAAFVVKKFLGASYVWVVLGAAFVSTFASISYLKERVIEHLCEQWPPVYFPNGISAILPLQMLSFGALGAIGGYWLAVKYDYWREHQAKAGTG